MGCDEMTKSEVAAQPLGASGHPGRDVQHGNAPSPSDIKKTWKEEKALRLFEKQNGLCWICRQPMLKPNFYKSPNRWMANIDHLVEKRKDGDHSFRPIKIAHMICNSSRHHLPISDPKVVEHVEWMKKRFSNQAWWKGVLNNVR